MYIGVHGLWPSAVWRFGMAFVFGGTYSMRLYLSSVRWRCIRKVCGIDSSQEFLCKGLSSHYMFNPLSNFAMKPGGSCRSMLFGAGAI